MYFAYLASSRGSCIGVRMVLFTKFPLGYWDGGAVLPSILYIFVGNARVRITQNLR